MMTERPKLTLKLANVSKKIANLQTIPTKKVVVINPTLKVKQEKVIKLKKAKKQKFVTHLEHGKYIEMLQYLEKKYPLCFKKGILLSIGIHKELLKLESDKYSKKSLRTFLKCYTRNKDYKETVEKTAERVNLQGKTVVQDQESSITKR